MKKSTAIDQLLNVMSRLRAPDGCPWDREQDHMSLRWHAVEEVYELIDAIESGDDHEIEEELGDLLLQVVFHCQLARERGTFDFDKVARHIAAKLIRRHPHVFGTVKVKDVNQVWANWERIKRAEKHGTKRARASALDGIPAHLPALLRAEKLARKARKAKLLPEQRGRSPLRKIALAARCSIWPPRRSNGAGRPRNCCARKPNAANASSGRENNPRVSSEQDPLASVTGSTYAGFAVKQPSINVDEKVDRIVGGRRAMSDSLKAGMRLQLLGAQLHKSFKHRWCPKGVYRFQTHEEADQWMIKMLARSGM